MFELDRGDMKLLTECGYSAALRNADTDVTPIFRALETWMPNQAAGPIGLALQSMIAGEFEAAAARLNAVVARPGGEGRAEARAFLAMCKALQNDRPAAEAHASKIDGESGSGSAQRFATLLSEGDEAHEMRNDDQRSVKRAAG